MSEFKVSFNHPLLISVALHLLLLMGFVVFQVPRSFQMIRVPGEVGLSLIPSHSQKTTTRISSQGRVPIAQAQPEVAAAAAPTAVENQNSSGASAGVGSLESSTLSGSGQLVLDSYVAELREALESNKLYPSAAKMLGQQGKVIVGFRVLQNGQIEEVRLLEASPYERLNEAALATVRRLASFKPIPAELKLVRWDFTVPVEFRLN